MQFVSLRARAVCLQCESRLPPRTEAWWDEEARVALCSTCERVLRAEHEAAELGGHEVAVAEPELAPEPEPFVPLDLTALGMAPEVTPELDPAVPAAAADAGDATPAATHDAAVAEPDRAVAEPSEPPAVLPADLGESGPPVAELPPRPPLPPVLPARGTGTSDVAPPAAPRGGGRPGPTASRRPPRPARPAPASPRLPAAARRRTDEGAPASGPRPADAAATAPGRLPARRPRVDPAPPAVVDQRPEEPAGPPPRRPERVVDADPFWDAVVRSAVQGEPIESRPEGLSAGDAVAATQPSHGAAPAPVDGDRRPAADLLGRLQPVGDVEATPVHPPTAVLAGAAPLPPGLDHELVRRGDAGEGRVGQTLEAGRIHGYEVLHRVVVDASLPPVDHVIVAVNGVWAIRAVDVLPGRLRRRDLGDWFTADPRLFLGEDDRTDLVVDLRVQVAALRPILEAGGFADIPVRGVLCFGAVQPAWVDEPLLLDEITVTWRSKLVEPLLEPVLLDQRSRAVIEQLLVPHVLPHGAVAGAPA